MPPPTVVREFVGLPSPTAPRAGAGGHPCQAHHSFTTPGTRDEQADAIASWIGARW